MVTRGIALLVIMFVSLVTMATPVAAVSPDNGTCQEVSLQVGLWPGDTANKTVAGTYCQPTTWAEGEHQIDILMHGGTYNRSYWDFPVSGQFYSYADRTLAEGRATFAFDQVGAGTSTKPLSVNVTVSHAAYVSHQVVQWARNVQDYNEVNLISHSMGSYTAMRHAGTYHDVDRVVITGALHIPGLGVGALDALSLYPAALDAQFAGQGLDLGYLTTQPGTRGGFFYSSSADPAVIAYDEAHKDIISSTFVSTVVTDLSTLPALNISKHITAPVLVVMGAEDTAFCGGLVSCAQSSTILANEAPYYSSAASVSAAAIADTGHNIALHPSASGSFSTINAWLESTP